MENSEGQRIARELHDGIAQDLIALGYSIDLILATPQAPLDIRLQLRTLRFDVDSLVSKVRREIFELRDLTSGHIASDLEKLAVSICGERLGSMDLNDFDVSDQVRHLITNIASELLRNSIYHSGCTRVDVSLSKVDDQILLGISDNGCGGAQISSQRFGLQGIYERLEQVNGTLHLSSNSNGTSAQVRL